MFTCLSCSNNVLNQKIETHSRGIQVICLVTALVGAILLGLSFHGFPQGSAAGAILTSDPLRYVALSCFLAATLDAVILYRRKQSTVVQDSSGIQGVPPVVRTPYAEKVCDLLNQAYEHEKAKRYKEMIECYKEAAMLNSAEALAILGDCYMYGPENENDVDHGPLLYKRGVTRDYKKAFMYYSRAAEMNHAKATRELGHCYQLGYGVEKNDAKAFECYRRAFEELNDKWGAGESLGFCYAQGIGTPKDVAKGQALMREYPRPRI